MSRRRHQAAATSQHTGRNRMLIAQEAARLICENGIGDYRQAAAKAAFQLGITGPASMPGEQELEDALREYQRLFRADSQPSLLHQRREAALAAMRFLEAFTPRLVGAVLDGTADAHSVVCLQVFSDDADAVSRFLHDQAVPVRIGARRLRLNRMTWRFCPALSFDADGIPFELVVLPSSALHHAPLAAGDERPMRRGSIFQLQQLLDEVNLPQTDRANALASEPSR